MFEKYANKIEYNEVEENKTKNGPNLPKNHDLQETDVFCKKLNKISQALRNFPSTSHRPLRTHAATQYVM